MATCAMSWTGFQKRAPGAACSRVALLVLLIAAGSMASGCTTNMPITNTPPNNNEQANEASTSTVAGTPEVEDQSATPYQSPTDSARELFYATLAAQATPLAPRLESGRQLAGLIYRTPAGTLDRYWLINRSGEHKPLTIDIPAGGAARVSPDLTQIIYQRFHDGDLWIFELASAQHTNLTNTPDIVEQYPRWAPAAPEVVVFEWSRREEGGFLFGHLGLMRSDGSDYMLYDEVCCGRFYPSPDGSSIAYGQGVFDTGSGTTILELADYGLSGWEFSLPGGWSQDGSKVALELRAKLANDEWPPILAIALFDLAEETAVLLHPHESHLESTRGLSLEWQPNGTWIAFSTLREDHYWTELGESASLWIARADGQAEVHLGQGDDPIWSPDGEWIIYSGSTHLAGPILVNTNTWQRFAASLPEGATPLQWLSLEP